MDFNRGFYGGAGTPPRKPIPITRQTMATHAKKGDSEQQQQQSSSRSEGPSVTTESPYDCRPLPPNVALNPPTQPISPNFYDRILIRGPLETLSMIDHVEKGVPLDVVCKVFELPQDEILRRVCRSSSTLMQVAVRCGFVSCQKFDCILLSKVPGAYPSTCARTKPLTQIFFLTGLLRPLPNHRMAYA